MEKTIKVGDTVEVIDTPDGRYKGVCGRVINRQAFEELHGAFTDVPKDHLFVRLGGGAVMHFAPSELEVI